MTDAVHVKCRACGIEYGQERRHGVLWPPSVCGNCGSGDVEVSTQADRVVDDQDGTAVIKEIVDEGDGQLFRIVRTSRTDAYVEARGPDGGWAAVDDELAARVYLAAYLELFDGIDALAEKARPAR